MLNVASTDCSAGTVAETRDDKAATELIRALATFAIEVESVASAVSKADTCADQVDAFVETFKLRFKVAVDTPPEITASAFWSNDVAVEIAEFSDRVCELRLDVASLIAVLMAASVCCIPDTAVCSNVETDSI